MPLHFIDSYLHNLFQVRLVLASSCPQGKLLKSSSEHEYIWDTQTRMPEGLRSLYTALHKPMAAKFWVLPNTFLSQSCICMSPVSFSSYQYTCEFFINTFSYFIKKKYHKIWNISTEQIILIYDVVSLERVLFLSPANHNLYG